jgi:hypothetical protein
MSNNHNNIYSILGKLESLTPKEQPVEQAPSLKEYANVPAKGSIIAGVKTLEETLNEKYMGFKKTVSAIEKGGSARDPEAVAAAIGREKYGKAKFQKAAAAGKKLGEQSAGDSDIEKVLDAVAKIYQTQYDGGDEIWDADWMQDWAHTLMQANPTDQELDFIIANGHMPNRLANVDFPVGDDFQFGESKVCAECGMTEGSCEHTKMEEEKTTHKGGEVSHKDGVTKHVKKDYPGYPADDLEDDDTDAPKSKGGKGRPRKAQTKNPRKDPNAEKKGRGRPKAEKPAEYSKSHDPFGRVKAGAEKSGKDIKGKKHTMDEVAPPGEKAERMVKHIKKSYAKDGKLTPKEKSIAYATTWKAHKAGTVEESMAQVQRKLTEGVNLMELLKEKQQTVDEMLSELSNDIKVFKETGHCSELLRDCMEIKGYHGKMVADEAAQVPSNPDPFHATKPAPAGIPGNLPVSQVPGKERLLKGKGPEYFGTGKPVDEVTLEDELNELARLAGLDEVSRGEYIKQQDVAAERSGKDKFNAFGQTFDTDEIKEVSRGEYIDQKDAEAEQAGKDKFKAFGQTFDTDEVNEEDLEEDKIDVADAPEATNKPRAKYATLKHITTQGDDLHREKSQNPGAAAKGDNPLTNKLTLEDRLAAEYESIKKVSQ